MKLDEAFEVAKKHAENPSFCQGVCMDDLIEAVEEHLKEVEWCRRACDHSPDCSIRIFPTNP